MATATPNLSLILPESTDTTVVRTVYNLNWNTIDDIFDTVTLTEFAFLDGVTSAIQTQLNAKQALDTGLTSIAALTTAADKMIYTTALDTYAVASLTAFARTVLDDADASTARTTLGLAIGTNVQAYDAGLTAIAALAMTDSSLLVGNGTTWVLETGDTLRTSLGLAIGTNVQASDATLTAVAGLTISANSLIYGTGADAFSVLATNATATNKFLREVSSGAPSWEILEAGDIPDISATYQPLDTALTNISALTYVSPSFIKLTADDTYAVRTIAETKTDLAYQLSDMSDVGVTTPTDKYALMADGDSWESRALVEADISDLGTAAALVADKLSVFAPTTSAQLAE